MATVFQVKEAICDIISDSLNAGLEPKSPERVDVFFGSKEADSDHPMVIVGNVATTYSAERMSARSTLRRYDLTYLVDIMLIPGLRFRTQRDYEETLYDLLDRVLTPLVRGDDNGESLLAGKLDGILDVEPVGDSQVIPLDDNRDPQYPVLVLQLAVNVIRN